MVVLSQLHILAPISAFHCWSFQNMMFDVFANLHDLKVLNSIIGSIAVYVVNMFSSKKISAKMFLHYQSMFENIAGQFSIRVIGFPNQHISKIIFPSSTFPVIIVLTQPTNSFLKTPCITMMVYELPSLAALIFIWSSFPTTTSTEYYHCITMEVSGI